MGFSARAGGAPLALLEEPRVLARDVALREADGVPLLAADGILVARERNDGPLSFVVLDDQLPHGGFACARLSPNDAREV